MQEFPTYILALIHLSRSVFMVSFGVAAYLVLKILQSVATTWATQNYLFAFTMSASIFLQLFCTYLSIIRPIF